jgi:hypothetical protein
MRKLKLIRFIVFLFLPGSVIGQTTEIKYLSGTGTDHTVDWDFFCSAGMNSGKWTKIAVPSCWEQQGFGSYNYGHDKFEDRLNETGLYRYSFKVPADWKGKTVTIVFDGVMTDALVKVNGKQAGPVHQGAFYRFKYDITHLIKPGKENQLEVLVKKHSDNKSVSLAERQADFWIFGGIFRPVYLEAKPVEHIQRVAIDALADGSFIADVYLSPVKNAVKVNVEIKSLSGKNEAVFEKPVSGGLTRISGNLSNSRTWSPESPNLYNAVFYLLDKNGNVIHQTTERFGFRTIEVRESDGVYVNGVRIKMKGVCRHTFHPDYGRTSSKALSIEDVNLMKDMNMNAVRMSHYPPETHFLDVCDSLGLFVLDELTAWQKPSYDDVVGRKLLEEMIERDVNHPSIIFWDNGNEGGENDQLNDDFAELDIQKREVLHPWQDYQKTNTLHYIEYSYLSHDGYSRRKIFFPTEFLHGLYDGGHGAGLDDYWQKMWNDPLCAGGFLWVFADEAIRRTDRNGEFDTDGNHAPDGILGPYHEKEGSFYTIKEIWAPVHFEKRYITKAFDGSFRIENRYFYTDLDQCKFMAEWVTFSHPDQAKSESVLFSQEFSVRLSPGQKGQLKIDLPNAWRSADVLRMTAHDPSGRLINTWSWPVKTPEEKAKELLIESTVSKPEIHETDSTLEVKANDLEFSFNKTNGTIHKVVKEGKNIPLSNGPVFVSRKKDVQDIIHSFKDNNLLLQVSFDNGDHFTWTVGGDGLLHLDVAYTPRSYSPFAGITFDYPEDKIAGMQWLGEGPYRVYKNRMKGTQFGLWNKKYNNTVTGESGFQYPEFKGYHSEIYWVKILGNAIPDFKIFVHSKDIFLKMLTPKEPKFPGHEKIEYPAGDLSFLHGINAIGSKFLEAEYSGPKSTVNQFFPAKFFGERLSLRLTFDFSTL